MIAPVLRAAAALSLLLTLLGARESHARDARRAEAVVREALSAVQRGSFDEAVDELELLADQGFVHRDASLARAYAYLERARSRAARPGDLGSSVAALEEARWIGPEEASVEPALERIRSEIARRRAREASTELVQRPALGRAITGLLPEDTWAIIAGLGSLLLTAGLFARRFVKGRGAEIAGAVGIVTGFVLFTTCGALAAVARHYRTSTRPAVVVANEARWLEADGRPAARRGRDSNVIPEGALVYVTEEREGRLRVEWGSLEGWVNASQLRLLATERPEPP
jgi:hypothetical protein